MFFFSIFIIRFVQIWWSGVNDVLVVLHSTKMALEESVPESNNSRRRKLVELIKRANTTTFPLEHSLVRNSLQLILQCIPASGLLEPFDAPLLSISSLGVLLVIEYLPLEVVFTLVTKLLDGNIHEVIVLAVSCIIGFLFRNAVSGEGHVTSRTVQHAVSTRATPDHSAISDRILI